ncbi:MAG: PspC domain-containing protein [bacterium]|nr:PspC domain-containing protein [bacterium]
MAGVCAGLAAEFDVPVTLVRASFLGGLLGPSLILTVCLYAVLWFLMPAQPGDESGLDRVVDAVTSLSGEARERVNHSDADFRR